MAEPKLVTVRFRYKNLDWTVTAQSRGLFTEPNMSDVTLVGYCACDLDGHLVPGTIIDTFLFADYVGFMSRATPLIKDRLVEMGLRPAPPAEGEHRSE